MTDSALFLVFLSVMVCEPAFSYARGHRSSLLDEAVQDFDAALVKPPFDQEVWLSPEELCDVKLLKFVSSARKSIDVAIYDINLDALVHELLIKSKTMPVRIVVDRRRAKGNHSLVPLLAKAGAQVRYGHQRGIMHNKFVVVDGKMIETGSFNHTNHASRANNENQVYLANPAIVSRYAQRFEKIWEQRTLWSVRDPGPRGVRHYFVGYIFEDQIFDIFPRSVSTGQMYTRGWKVVDCWELVPKCGPRLL